jgi:hypothetical protein
VTAIASSCARATPAFPCSLLWPNPAGGGLGPVQAAILHPGLTPSQAELLSSELPELRGGYVESEAIADVLEPASLVLRPLPAVVGGGSSPPEEAMAAGRSLCRRVDLWALAQAIARGHNTPIISGLEEGTRVLASAGRTSGRLHAAVPWVLQYDRTPGASAGMRGACWRNGAQELLRDVLLTAPSGGSPARLWHAPAPRALPEGTRVLLVRPSPTATGPSAFTLEFAGAYAILESELVHPNGGGSSLQHVARAAGVTSGGVLFRVRVRHDQCIPFASG